MTSKPSKELPLTGEQEAILLSEVRLQCEFILIAQLHLNVAENTRWHENVETYGWAAVQAMLTAAANLSKLVGGTKGPEARQRSAIRARLGITAKSVLHRHAIRDATEHFDSRLLVIYAGQRVWASRMFGFPLKGEADAMDPRVTLFHDYDPKTGLLSFAEHSISLRELVAEARRIDAIFTSLRDPNTVTPRKW
jgi:hypothetical protein